MKKKEYVKGEIIKVNLGDGLGAEKEGVRPALVVSNYMMNHYSRNIVVAPITKAANKSLKGKIYLLPTQVYLSKKYYNELELSSIVQLEDVRSISKERVFGRVCKLSKSSMDDVDKKLKVLFDI